MTMLNDAIALILPTANLLFVLFGFLGWGRIVSRWVEPAPDWGVAIGWGMSAVLAIGGWLIAFDLSFPIVLAAVLGIGLLGLRAGQPVRPPSAVLVMALICFATLMIRHVSGDWVNSCDDHLAYFGLVEQAHDTGGLEQPFSLRRLAAYGGQILLQEATTLTGDWHYEMALEQALMPVVIFALLLGGAARRRGVTSSLVVLAYLLTLGFPEYRANTASEATTTALVLTLLRTLELTDRAVAPSRLMVLAGLVAAALSTLRDSNLAFPAVLFGSFMLLRYRLFDWPGYRREGLLLGLSWVGFLLPWAIALQDSSATPLYPVIRGFHHADFDTYGIGGGLAVWRAHGLGIIAHAYPTLGAAVAALLFWRSRLAFCGMLSALTSAALIVVLFSSADVAPLMRYCYPFLRGASYFAIAGALSARWQPGRRLEFAASAIGLAVMTLHLVLLFGPKSSQIENDQAYQARIVAYRAAQALVPPGEKILVFTAAPHGFDGARNPILNLDLPGPVSPPPGMPFFHGPTALAHYLAGLGIRHVIYDDFDVPVKSALNICVNRPEWRLWKTSNDVLLRKYAPYGLDVMANLEAFAGRDKVLFQQDGVTAVELTDR